MKPSDIVESILAVLVIGGIVAIAVFDVVTGKPVNIPPELMGFGLLVLGSYFRGRSVNGTIANLTSALQSSVPASAVTPVVPGSNAGTTASST